MALIINLWYHLSALLSIFQDGLLAVITIINEHNHNLNTAEALRYLSANKHLRMKFEEYFTDGMTITEAIR